MTNADRLRACFSRALSVPLAAITDDLRWGGAISRWDSLGHMELVMQVEEQFGVSLSPEDALAMDSFGSALAIVDRLLAEMEQAQP